MVAFITSEPSMDLVPVTLARNLGLDMADYGRFLPQVVVLSVITIVVLLGLHRYFVSSPASSGSKIEGWTHAPARVS